VHVVWDPDKARRNVAKHGISFTDAESVLFDSHAVTIEDRKARGEARFISIGLDSLGRILVVVFTHRGDDLRLISARPATRKERQDYEEGI
jgi:uncharacterized DUF497 family protein